MEPSQIIFEGLTNILSKSGCYFKLFRLDSIGEIENLYNAEKINLVIINPVQIQNRTREFISIKKKLTEIAWAGFVYTFIDNQLLSMFDKLIHITDSPENIVDYVCRLVKEDHHSSQLNEQEQLTDRETEVLKLIVAGLSNKEIADRLFISIHTVISHRKNISQKTGIKSQAGLTIYAISNKIIQIEDYKS
jgi:DNA-binding CsgD family transcriptional regulator